MEFKILLMEKFTSWSSGSSAVGGGTGRPVKRLDLSSFQDKRLLFKTNWRNNTGSKSEKSPVKRLDLSSFGDKLTRQHREQK